MSAHRKSEKVSRAARHVVEQLEQRVLLATTVTGVPNWTEQGPGPMTGSQVAGIPNQPVTGAIHAIVADPDVAHAGTFWVGTVGGGIWKTTNNGVSWLPKTDQLPSTAISALALDPLDHNILWAGTGKVSSSSLDTGRAIGLLMSSDGGETWKNYRSVFASNKRSINAIVPTRVPQGSGRVLLVGSDANKLGKPIGGGLLRSTGGAIGEFKRISGTSGTGLPAGTVTDIESDPGNINRFYAGVAGQGVFRSDDAGLTWTPVTMTGVSGLTGAAATVRGRIVLSVSEKAAPNGNFPVYAAMVEQVESWLTAVPAVGAVTLQVAANPLLLIGDSITLWDQSTPPKRETRTITNVATAGAVTTITINRGTGIAHAIGDYVDTGRHRVRNIFRSDDLGVMWTAIGAPGDVDGGIHPGGQADNQLSLLADRSDAYTVYVGGDRQPMAGPDNVEKTPDDAWPNATGARNYTGRLFRGVFPGGVGLGWSSITDTGPGGTGANGTGPHADSRAMVFNATGDILEVDDGGIYRLSNPTSNTRVWQSANGNLRLTELYSVAWDSTTNRILGGAQDNGNAFQSATNGLGWANVQKGDGAVVQVDGANGLYSNQNFGSFTIGGRTPGLRVAGSSSGANPLMGLAAFDSTVQFVQPFVVNSVAPNRLLIGTSYLYESVAFGTLQVGDVVTALGGAPLASGTTFRPNRLGLVGRVSRNAMVYGGMEGATAKPDIGWVGTSGFSLAGTSENLPPFLFVRQTGANTRFVPVNSWSVAATGQTAPNSRVVAVAVDPTDWRNVYVLDATNRIWFSDDGGKNPNLPMDANNPARWQWVELTRQSNNLLDLAGAKNLQDLAVFRSGTQRVILVGGEGGLFRRIDTIGGGNGMWSEYGGGPLVGGVATAGGGGLPNAIVTDVDLTSNNQVLVGTMGRGAFTAPTADLATPGAVTVVVNAGNVSGQIIRLRRDAARPWLLNVYEYPVGSVGPQPPAAVVPLASIDRISITGAGGPDQIFVDYSFGAISVPNGIGVTGGGGADSLSIVGPAGGKGVSSKTTTNVLTVFTNTVVSTDAFGVKGTQTVTWNTADVETQPAPAQLASAVDVLGAGLNGADQSLQHGLSNSASRTSLAALDPQSLGAALSGVRIGQPRPKDESLLSVSAVSPTEEVQLDNATSILRRLISEGLNGFDLSDIDADGDVITTPALLRDALDALDAVPNNVTLDTTTDADADGSADTTLAVKIVDRRLGGIVNLAVNADTAAGQVRLSGALEVDAEVDLDIVIGADANGFFIRPSAIGAPAIRLRDMKINGAVSGSGRFGFLGVDVTGATLTVDPDVGIDVRLLDPGTDAADGFIRMTELSASDVSSLIEFSIDGDPGDATPDVILNGTFSASAVIPGTDARLPLIGANLDLRWADLADPSAVTFNAAAGSTGAKILEFLKVTSTQVVDQLKSLRGNLETLSKGPMAIDLTMVQDVLNDVIRLVETFDKRIVNPLLAGGEVGAGISTIQDFVATLAGELGISVDSLAYDPASGELTYRVDLAQALSSSASPAGVRFELPGGLSINAGASAAATGQFDLGFVFGIDVGGIAAGGAVLDNVFLNNATMGAIATINIADLDAAANLGFVGLSTSDGIASATANVSLALKDPNATSTRLTMRALGSAITTRPLDLLVGRAPTLSGSASVDLRNIAINGLPGINPAAGARVAITIADLKNPQNATVQAVGLDNLADFNSISGEDVLAALAALADYLVTLKGASIMGTKVPFTSATIGDVVDFSNALTDKLLAALADPAGNPLAKTAQALADRLSAALGVPLGTINALYDAATRELRFRVLLQTNLDPVQTTIQVAGALGPVAVLNADTTLSLAGGAGLDFIFGADLSRRTLTITAAADAPLNGRLTTAANFRITLGTDAAVAVVVPADATNNSIDDLVADVNTALTTAGLAATLIAARSGNKLTLATRPDVSRSRITLNAVATDAAVTQMKFVDGVSAADDVAGRFFVSNASLSGTVTAAATNVRLGAKIGFIDIGVDNGSASLNAAVALRLQPPGGPAGGKIAISRLLGAILTDPLSVVAAPTLTGSAAMDLPLVIEGGVLGAIVGTPALTVRWTDITDPGTLSAVLNGAANPLNDLKDLSFADILAALKGIAGYFLQLKGYSFLNQKLPLLNKSVTDLLDFAQDFADRVDRFEQNPAGSLQELALKLASALGLPTNAINITIEGKVLKIGFDLSRSLSLTRAVDLDLAALVDALPAGNPVRGFLQGIASVLDVQGSAVLALGADARVRLNLGLDYTTPASPRAFVYNTTGITLGLKASGTNLSFTTALGPLGVYIKNGSAFIDGDGIAATDDKAIFSVGLIGDPAGRTYLSDLGTDDANVTLAGQVHATLPLFFPTQSNSIGDLSLAITNLSNIPGTITMTAPDLGAQASTLNLLNNLGLVIDGLDLLLATIQRGLNNAVFSNKLPLIGDSLSRGGQFIQDLRTRVVADLRAALDGAGDKSVALVQDGLLAALGPAGLKLLQDVDASGTITRDDVPAVFRDTDGNGSMDQVQFDLRLRQALSLINTPIAFDAGLPGLGLTIDGNVQARLSFDFALSFGVSSNTAIGFYVDTSRTNELSVQLEAGIPGLRAAGRLGPLMLDVTDSATSPSNLTASFAIDLRDRAAAPGDPPADNRLTFNEVTSGIDISRLAAATLTADANVNLGAILGFGNNAKFPSFASDFELKWKFAPADGMRGGVPTVAFKNVRLDLASFIGSFVGPVLSKIRDITAPLQPMFDAITRPIPILTGITGKPTSLLNLAQSEWASSAFGESSKTDIRMFLALAGVFELVSTVPSVPGNTFVPLGSFDLAGVDLRGLTDLSQANPNVTEQKDADAAIQQTGAKDFFNATKNVGGSGSGLQFPILSNPSNAFKLLMGKDVDLVTYDMAPMSLGFEYAYTYIVPVGNLPIAITVRLGAGFKAFADLAFGFDTRGIRTAVETGNPADVFGGFYLLHVQGVPEAGLSGSVFASGEAGVVVADFGFQAELKASLLASLKDPDKDGKVYLDEFINGLQNGLLCTFDVSGSVDGLLSSYVEIGFGPLAKRTDWLVSVDDVVDWNLSEDACFSTRLEPNDLRETAADIGVGPGIHLDSVALATPTDKDWYKFTVLRPVDSINVQILFKNVSGNIDMDVVGPDGRLLGRSATSKDREIVTLENVQAGTYYVNVYGRAPETPPNNYRLYVDPGPGSKTRVFYLAGELEQFANPRAARFYTQGIGDDANDGTDFTKPKKTLASLLAAYDLGPDDIVLFDGGKFGGPTAMILAEDEGAIYAGATTTPSKLIGAGGVPSARIVVDDSDGSLFYRLQFDGNGGIGLDLRGDGVDDAKDNIFLGNIFRVGGGVGMNVFSDRANPITGNQFFFNSTGLVLAPRATAAVVGNRFSGNATGVYVESTAADISGNEIDLNGVGAAVNGRGVFGPTSLANANIIHDNTTGVSVFSTATNAVVRFNRVDFNSIGIRTAATTSSILGNEILRNTVGLTGIGLLGPGEWSNPNDIHDNETGVVALAGTATVPTVVRFNRIRGNGTGIRLANATLARNNLIYRNTGRGVLISGTSGAQVINNTIYEPTADGVHVAAGSSNARLRNNIIWTQAGYALRVDLDSQAGFDSDYNNLFTSGTGKIGWWQKDFTDLYGWMVEVNSDNRSIGYTPLDPTLDNPRFLNAAADDYRVADFVSTGIDSGDPSTPFNLEAAPGGARVDLGAYGNTSRSAQAPASYIRLDSPNFYEDWEADEGHVIRWYTYNVSGNVTIELYTAAGVRIATLGTAPAAQGAFQWTPRDSGIIGNSASRYRIRISSGATVGQTREPFSVPTPGGNYYLNDSATAGDAYTTAAGNLRATGKTPGDPKTLLVGLMREYDLEPGDTVYADTGYYLHVRTVVISGNVAINDDEGVTITGPLDAAKVAAFDRGGVAGGLPLSLDDGDFVTLRRLALTGGQMGLWVRNASVNFTGSYLTTYGNTLDGIRIESDALNTTLDRLFSYNNGRDGVYLGVPVAALTDSVAYQNGAAGFRLNNVGATRVQRNESYNNAVGIDLMNPFGGPQTLIGSADLAAGLGNKVHDNRGAGINAAGPALVAGNTVYRQLGANQAGIVTGSGAQATNNVVFNNVDGIRATFGTGAITNNRVYNNRRYGISADSVSAAISGNVVYSNSIGINTVSSSSVISNNLVYANAAHGVALSAARGEFRNNTVYQEIGDALRVTASRGGLSVRNNILRTDGGIALYVAKDSQADTSSDYNLFYTTGSSAVGYWQEVRRVSFGDWRNASFLDSHSLFADPLFVNVRGPDNVLGFGPGSDGRDDDLHEKSTVGSFRGGALAPVLDAASGLPLFPVGAFVPDAVNSPALDRGRPTDSAANEPSPNGAFVNLGAYGNTSQASKSTVPYVLVTNPNGGETLPGNQTFTIEWRAESYTGTVNIELLRAGNPTVVLLIGDNVPNTGAFAWRVPASVPAADDYVLRVTRNEATPLADASNAPFSIVPPIRAYYVNDGTVAAGDWTTAAGDDANDGLSPATPKASIRALLEAYQFSAGDVIKVDAGSYPLTANIIITAADAGVRIEGYYDALFPTRVALINRASTLPAAFAFELRGASGVTLDRLSITGGEVGVNAADNALSHDVVLSNNVIYGNYRQGVFFGSANDRVSILGNTLYGFAGGMSADNQVVGIQMGGADATISGNSSFDFQNIGIYVTGARASVTGNNTYRGGLGSFGITGIGIQAVGVAGAPTVISGNNVYSNSSGGINVNGNVVVTNNAVYNQTGVYGIFAQGAARVSENRIYGNLDGVSTGFGAPLISNNRIFNNSRYGLVATNSTATFSGNAIYSNGTGAALQGYAGTVVSNLIYANRTGGIVMPGSGTGRLFNNTIYQLAGDAVTVSGATNVLVLNNIIQVNAGYAFNISAASQPTFTSDYNTIFVTGTGKAALLNGVAQPTLAVYQNASAKDLRSIGDDPKFNNPTGGDGILGYVTVDGGGDDDFRVQPSSPTIDRGHPLSPYYAEPVPNGGRTNQGFDGNTPDAQNSPAQLVQVLSPNGGEKLNPGEAVSLDWRTSGLTAIRPVMLIDSGSASGADNFLAETLVTGQTAVAFAAAVSLAGVTNPAPAAVYQNYAAAGIALGSVLAYQLPVANGTYALRLHFAEPVRAAGRRLMDIRINGVTVRAAFDIAAAAGGPLKAYVLDLPATAAGGAGIRVELVTANSFNDPAIINGIEFLQADPGGVANATADLDVSLDNGATWLPVAAGVAMDRFGRGSFTWTPDAATSGLTGFFRVRANDGSQPQDVSDAPFLVAPTGRDYYVNDAGTDGDVFTTAPGDDANDGKSPGRPMASLSSLLDQYNLGAGDVIRVDTGNYRLLRNILLLAGDSGVTIRGPVGNTAVLDRNAITGYVFEVRGATDVTLDSLSITGAKFGVWATAGSTRLTLSNSTVYANAEAGIVADATSDFLTIDGNEFYGFTGASTDQNVGIDTDAPHVMITGNSVRNMPLGMRVASALVAGEPATISGNTVFANGTGIDASYYVRVVGNTVYGNAATGIVVARYASAIDNVVYGNVDGINSSVLASPISGNRVFNNSRYGLYSIGQNALLIGNTVYSNGYGIYGNAFTGEMSNNLVYANAVAGITIVGVDNSVFSASAIFNNTVYQLAGDAMRVLDAFPQRLRNNILWAANGSAIVVSGRYTPVFLSEYNNLVRGNGPLARVGTYEGNALVDFADWQETSLDANSISVDPAFVDFDGADNLLGFVGGIDRGGDDNFRVTLTSPTVDAGDPQSYYLAEPAPNGGRANLGYDGNTPRAQISPAQTLQLLTPNGGERITAGSVYNITWRSSGLTSMRPLALINSGGGATGNYAADDYFAAGPTGRATGRAVDLTGVVDPGPAAIYQSYLGAGGGAMPILYQLPVPAGTYTLRLHFVEPSAAAGVRRMEIRVNGALVRENFDVSALAGGAGRAYILTLPVTASDTSGIALQLVSRLTPGFPAIISGVEVLAADPDGFNAPNADVDVSTDNGATWTPVATNVVLDRFGNGSALWTAGPETNGATALVRVRTAVGSRPQDNSDRPFFVPRAGRDFYINDASLTGDVFTIAVGSNANDGKSPAKPMSSLSRLLEAYDLGPGDVVHVDTGTYRLVRDVFISANDAGVRIEGPASGVALFDRANITVVGTNAFEIRAAGVTIDRLSITGASTGILVGAGSFNAVISNNTVFANEEAGISVEAGADGVTITGNTVYGLPASDAVNQDFGLLLNGAQPVVTGNSVRGAARVGIQYNAQNGRLTDNVVFGSATGVVFGRSAAEVITVSGNRVYGNATHGINADFGNKLITGNTVYGNGQTGIVATVTTQVRNNVVYGNLDGISASGTAVVTGNRVFNNSRFGLYNVNGGNTFDGNLVYQNSVGFRAVGFGGIFSNNAVYSNTNQGVLITGSNGGRLYNNTIYQPVGDAVAVQTSSNIKIRNNILWTLAGYALNIAADSRTGFASDFNDLVRGDGGLANVGFWNGVALNTLAAWQAASGTDANSISVDPRFVDLDGADNVLGYTNNSGGYDGGADDNFELLAGSPAIDRGDGVVAPAKDLIGASRSDDPATPNGPAGFADLGAYEFLGNSADTTPPTVAGTTPAAAGAGGAVAGALSQIVITFSEPVGAIDAAAPANYEFRGAGADGAFGTDDDIVYLLSPQFTVGSTDVRLDIVGGTRASGIYRLTVRGQVGRGIHDASGVLLDGDGNGAAGGDYVRQFTVTHKAAVVARHLFYNNSSFDGFTPAPLAADDAAVAADKVALLPGQTGAFKNYSSYDKGINGVMIDLTDLPASSTLSAADFMFRVGNDNNPGAWVAAPAPLSITIRRGVGAGGSDRVVVVFADKSILNRWLQVTLKAGPITNLAVPDVFYFGSLVGDTGDASSPLRVGAIDVANARRNVSAGPEPVTNVYDFNRDGRVNGLDYVAQRVGLRRALNAFQAPATTPAAPVAATTSSLRLAQARRVAERGQWATDILIS